jgi:outer membrane protein OmpA-like peptidoglycan-associated protein
MSRLLIGIAICFTAIITRADAQGLNIELNGGLQGTRFQLQNGQSQLLPGGSLGLTYSFRLGDNWDLLSGVTGGVYRTKASLRDGVVFTTYEVDDLGSAFQYTMKTVGYKETQQFFAAAIPLLLQYHTTGTGVQWYFDAGGKVSAPFNSSINVSAKQLTLSGYYPDFNIDVSNLPEHGFGTVNGWKTSATTKLSPSAALSAATGVSFSLSSGSRLYAGLYVDYGLTTLKEKTDSMPLVTYNPNGIAGVRAGSVLNGSGTGQVNLLSFGLQLRLSFGSARPKAERSNTKKEPPPPLDSALSIELYEVIERAVVFGLPNETTLPDIQKEHLDEVADILKQYPTIRIALVGHTCNSETQTENKNVGAARARAVAKYLRSKGVDASRLDISPVVVSDEFDPDNPPANYRNRRVVIAVR